MKTTKLSLANIQGKLSRVEMKKIMAGSTTGGGSGGCSSSPCAMNMWMSNYGCCAGWHCDSRIGQGWICILN